MKRAWLLAFALGIMAAGPARVQAAGEVDAVGYGGTTAGGWACGPNARANYAGGGARVRASERPLASPEGAGLVAETAAAGEFEATTISGCAEGCDSSDRAPPDAVLAGASARTGYHWSSFGVEVGAVAFQAFGNNLDESPSIAVLPAAELSVGRAARGRFVAGVGRPTVTTQRRPGIYAGTDFSVETYRVELRGGLLRQGPSLSRYGPRADAAVFVPVRGQTAVRLGASGGVNNQETLDGEASIGIRVGL